MSTTETHFRNRVLSSLTVIVAELGAILGALVVLAVAR